MTLKDHMEIPLSEEQHRDSEHLLHVAGHEYPSRLHASRVHVFNTTHR